MCPSARITGSRRLVAAPFCGEFGWELMSWQAYLRHLAKSYDEVVVCSRAGRAPLYSDFATKFVPHSIKGLADCWWTSSDQRLAIERLREELLKDGGVFIGPRSVPLAEQDFIPFGRAEEAKHRFDVIVHARGEVGKRFEAAWEPSHCDQVVERLLKLGLTVGAIGTQAYSPVGAEDCRNVGLQADMDLLAACGVAIGPSSGPLHLASLCRAKHIVWTDRRYFSRIKATNRQRYETKWNPLNTPVMVVDAYGWQPPVDVIVRSVQEAFEKWKIPTTCITAG